MQAGGQQGGSRQQGWGPWCPEAPLLGVGGAASASAVVVEVDVLAVSATLALQDYPDDSIGIRNPRDTVLKVGRLKAPFTSEKLRSAGQYA